MCQYVQWWLAQYSIMNTVSWKKHFLEIEFTTNHLSFSPSCVNLLASWSNLRAFINPWSNNSKISSLLGWMKGDVTPSSTDSCDLVSTLLAIPGNDALGCFLNQRSKKAIGNVNMSLISAKLQWLIRSWLHPVTLIFNMIGEILQISQNYPTIVNTYEYSWIFTLSYCHYSTIKGSIYYLASILLVINSFILQIWYICSV